MEQAITFKFLVVENVEYRRRAELRILRDLGYAKVFEADNAQDAWDIFKRQGIDFVLSAWNMPGMNGLDLLRTIRAEAAFAKAPFFLMVDSISKDQVIEAGEAGVTDIVTTPLSRKTLQEKIARALRDDARTKEFTKWFNRGVDLMETDRYEEALEVFQHVLTIYESAETFYNVGYIKTNQGKYEEALLAFHRATQINAAHALAFHKMGEVYGLLGRDTEARECLVQAAEIYMDKHMDKDAESIFTRVLKLDPGAIDVYNSLGILYRRQGRYAKAVECYQNALLVIPDDEHIFYNLARAYADEKNWRPAREALKKALQINPELHEARNLLKSLEVEKPAGRTGAEPMVPGN